MYMYLNPYPHMNKIIPSNNHEMIALSDTPELESVDSNHLQNPSVYNTLFYNEFSGNFLVSEGFSTNKKNSDFNARIGEFNSNQQERAWAIYCEKIIPENLEETKTPLEDLTVVCDQLQTSYQKDIALIKDNTQLYVNAGRVYVAIHDIFLELLRTSAHGIMTIKGGTFQISLDNSLIKITQIFIRVVNEKKTNDSIQIKYILTELSILPMGHKYIWAHLEHLINTGNSAEAFSLLILWSPKLYVTKESIPITVQLCKNLFFIDSKKFLEGIEKIKNFFISDLLYSHLASCYSDNKDPNEKYNIATRIINPNKRAEILLSIATKSLYKKYHFKNALKNAKFILTKLKKDAEIDNCFNEAEKKWEKLIKKEFNELKFKLNCHGKSKKWLIRKANELWEKNKLAKALISIGIVETDYVRDEWYLTKASELWSKGNITDSESILQRLTFEHMKEEWYLEKANELWLKGNVIDSESIIQRLTFEYKKEEWYLEKANELWLKGYTVDAESILQRLTCKYMKEEWYLEKANELWSKGNVIDSESIIQRLTFEYKKEEWYLEKANELWLKGYTVDAERLIQNVRKHTKEEWYLVKANELWLNGNTSDSLSLIKKLNSDSAKDKWYMAKADELWINGCKLNALSLVKKLFLSTMRNNWYFEKAYELLNNESISEARSLVQIVPASEKKDKWLIKNADELWSNGNISNALILVQNVDDNSERDHWYIPKINELWFNGKISKANELIQKMQSSILKQQVTQANELWSEGKFQEATSLILTADEKIKSNWLLTKASELVSKEDIQGAISLIQNVANGENKDNWYFTNANDLWKKGNKSQVDLFIEKIVDPKIKSQWFLRKS